MAQDWDFKLMTPSQIMNREIMVAYLELKVAEEDWHGVSDAANDLREMDAVLKVSYAI